MKKWIGSIAAFFVILFLLTSVCLVNLGNFLPVLIDVYPDQVRRLGYLSVDGRGVTNIKLDAIGGGSEIFDKFIDFRRVLDKDEAVEFLFHEEGWEQYLERYRSFVAFGTNNWREGSETLIGEFIYRDEAALVFKRALIDEPFEPIDVVFFIRVDGEWRIKLNLTGDLEGLFPNVIAQYAILYRRAGPDVLGDHPPLLDRFVTGVTRLVNDRPNRPLVSLKYHDSCDLDIICSLNITPLSELASQKRLDERSFARMNQRRSLLEVEGYTIFSKDSDYEGRFDLGGGWGVAVFSGSRGGYQFYQVGSSGVQLINAFAFNSKVFVILEEIKRTVR